MLGRRLTRKVWVPSYKLHVRVQKFWFLDFLLAKMYVATVETLLHPSRRGIHSSQGRIPLWEGWILSFNRTWVYSKAFGWVWKSSAATRWNLDRFSIFFLTIPWTSIYKRFRPLIMYSMNVAKISKIDRFSILIKWIFIEFFFDI